MKTQRNKRLIKKKMVPNSSVILYTPYPPNRHDTCGYTASCFLLLYYHRKFGGFVPEEFLNRRGALLTTGYTLQDALLQLGEKNLTWGGSITKVLNRYFEKNGIKAKACYRLFGFGARRRVKAGTPVILFGNMWDKKENRINHAVLAYGLSYEKKITRFIVHYGWKGWEQQILREAIIGSYVFLKLG